MQVQQAIMTTIIDKGKLCNTNNNNIITTIYKITIEILINLDDETLKHSHIHQFEESYYQAIKAEQQIFIDI